jgi:hypothetical protein
LRGKRYENEKKIVTNEKGVNQHTNEVNHQNDAQPKPIEKSKGKTSIKLAKEYGLQNANQPK